VKANSKIYIAGHNGLVGSAIHKTLLKNNFTNILCCVRRELDLTKTNNVEDFFRFHKPEYVFLAAAKVGGIMANLKNKAEFIYDNLMIQTNIINSAYRNGCKKLLFLGSSCIYPKDALVPISEEAFMRGPLEESNDAYAIAKIAGIKMCQSYNKQYDFNAISLMPTNIYGPRDNFDIESSHVLGSFIRRFDDAKNKNLKHVTCWGDGSPLREFLYVDDLAEACIFCMRHYNNPGIINVGTGKDITIKELANMISSIIGYEGDILWDSNKPNGTHRKVLDINKIEELGWKPKTSLKEGIIKTYSWYKNN
jgi:GDP-L-fucose synthase